MQRFAAAALVMYLTAACGKQEPELGVDVFSTDTIPVRIRMDLTGTLQMGLRAESYLTAADRSLILVTPASLLIQKGAGSATIFSVDTNRRIAVQPLGLSPDSAEKAGVVGRVVRLTRVEHDGRLKLEVESP